MARSMLTMDCTELAKIFAGDREDDLDPTASKAFEEHLNGCSSCLEALAGAEDETAPLAAWEAPEPSDEEWARSRDAMWSRIDAEGRAVVVPGPWARLPAFLAAAAALLFVVGLAFVLTTSAPPSRNGATAKFPDDLPNKPEDSGASSPKDSAPSSALKGGAQLVGEVEVADGYEQHTEEWPVLCVVISEKA